MVKEGKPVLIIGTAPKPEKYKLKQTLRVDGY